MINYADYEFYKNEYRGNLSLDLFNSLIIKASRVIDRNINRELTQKVIDNLSEREQFELKYTACKLCDFINATGGDVSNTRTNSISIDGVSINKSQKSEAQTIRDKQTILGNLPDSLTRFL